MHRSHWDIEVYAKDFQERRWQEAARRRLTNEAARRETPHGAVNPFMLAIAHVLNTWRSRLAPKRAATGSGHGAEPVATPSAEIVAVSARPKRARAAQPYADMVVIARGPMVNVTEQPSGVSDC
jgi:hypothetical protein